MKKIKLLVDARNFGGEGQGSLTYLKGLYLALLESYGDEFEGLIFSFIGKLWQRL